MRRLENIEFFLINLTTWLINFQSTQPAKYCPQGFIKLKKFVDEQLS